MRLKLFLVSFVAAIAALSFLYQMPVRTSGKTEKFRTSDKPIPNRYIVVVNDTDENGRDADPSDRASEHAKGFAMRVDKIYGAAVKGYSAEMSKTEALRLSNEPDIKYVEEDAEVAEQSMQANAPWGLGRIDQRNFSYPLDTNYQYEATGAGVNVYVLDSGIKTDHPEFGGRAVNAFDAYNDPTPINQCNGHGTHVAGTIGSNTYGVAKGVNIFSVRVLPCTGFGTSSTLLAGIEWVTRHAARPAVANLSLLTTRSDAIEQAVRNSINSGVTYVAAAGNYNADACGYSPGHLPDVITVGSIDNRDYRDPNTNYGSCIDVFAPGVGVVSTWNTELQTFNMGGTSTASPHVAGAAALYLQMNPTASAAEVSSAIVNSSTVGALTDIGNQSPNRLLFTIFQGGGAPEPACSGGLYTGIFAAAGETNYQSSENGFSGGSGQYRGTLQLPERRTFVLNLEQKKGRSWNVVASSPGLSSTETVSYRGKSGTYRWRVRSVYGAGDYSLCTVIP